MILENTINATGSEWRSYRNGNYDVYINLLDGTKIRLNNEDKLVPEFAESIDLNITNKCEVGCSYCYQGCTKDGKHSDLLKWETFIDSLRPYTEVAINGNDLDHPSLEGLLIKLEKKHVIANITVHQDVFLDVESWNRLSMWNDLGLVGGIGISVNEPTDKLISSIKHFNSSNIVIHVIAGIFNKKHHDILRSNNLKLLVLGYKSEGRGNQYILDNSYQITNEIAWLKENIYDMVDDYSVIGFDTRAVVQLELNKDKKYYMGDDGEYTFFVDLVSGVYAKNSVSDFRDQKKMARNMTAAAMFQNIRSSL